MFKGNNTLSKIVFVLIKSQSFSYFTGRNKKYNKKTHIYNMGLRNSDTI